VPVGIFAFYSGIKREHVKREKRDKRKEEDG
jgi:hypothetical protein